MPLEPQKEFVIRRFRRFSAKLPITVLTNPSPPYWIPLWFKGETIEIGRGGTSASFLFDVTRFLYPSRSVQVLIGHGDHLSTYHTINARVAWAQGQHAGFEFKQVMRKDPTVRDMSPNSPVPDAYKK